MTYDPDGNVFKQILDQLKLSAIGDSSGGAVGDTPETLSFYGDTIGQLNALGIAVAAGADTAAAVAYYTAAVAHLTSIQAAIETAAAHVLTTSAQTLNALGLSTSVSAINKRSVAVQLLWSGASTDQVVRLSGSYDGGTTWHLIGDDITGVTFTQVKIDEYAAVGLELSLRTRMDVPELTHVRLKWEAGTATNLTLKWGNV